MNQSIIEEHGKKIRYKTRIADVIASQGHPRLGPSQLSVTDLRITHTNANHGIRPRTSAAKPPPTDTHNWRVTSVVPALAALGNNSNIHFLQIPHPDGNQAWIESAIEYQLHTIALRYEGSLDIHNTISKPRVHHPQIYFVLVRMETGWIGCAL